MNKREVKRLYRAIQKTESERLTACEAYCVARDAYNKSMAADEKAREAFAAALAEYGRVVIDGLVYYEDGGTLQMQEIKQL